MNSIIETLNQFGGQFLQFAWPMLWQSSLLIGFVLALDFLLARKIRASVRYALWLAVLVKLLLPPTLALPTGAAWWLFRAPPIVKAPAIKNYTVTYNTTPLTDYIPPTVALPPPAPPQLNGAGWALLATGAFSAGLLLWLALRWWQVARMVRGATAVEDFSEPLAEAMRLAGAPVSDPASFKKGIQRAGSETGAPRLKIVEGRMSPAVCGLFRPVILLPRTLAEQLSPTQLRAVLLHEAFHLRRKDVWVNCAQALLQIVYWWHPLLWIANARIRRVREEAVDDAVMLALRDEADSYAPTLLEVAKLAFRRPLMSLGLVGIMESRSALRHRIERLVDFRAPRKAGLTLASLCGICVFSAVALPMGEAPNQAGGSSPAATDASVAEQQSLTIRVNPEIFFRNLKAQAPNVMQSPTNDWSDILMELLRDEGVDSNPPHGLAFTNATGDITTQNTPAQLAIFRRVIEQLNRADGKCELPLRNNPLRKNVLIEGRIYPMSDGEFDKFTSGLHHYSGKLFGDDWWSVPPDMFKQFINEVEASGLRLIQRPRIQTSSGIAAELYVGDSTNGLDLTCRPVVGDGFVDLTLASTVVSGAPMNAVTNHVSSKASAEDHGGIVLRMANYDGQAGSNLVVVISAEILTNASPQLHERLQAVIQRSGGGSNFNAVIHALEQRGGAKTLAEPEVTTTSGRSINRIATPISAPVAKVDPQVQMPPAGKQWVLPTARMSPPIANATNKLVYAGPGRQRIINKLDRIRLDNVSFDSLPLSEVLRMLAKQSELRDPDHEGINFLINPNPDKPKQAIDPATGMSLPPTLADTNSEPVDVGSFIVKIPSLTNVCLMDVLDAIVTVCDHPIKYSIQDFAVVFTAKGPETPQLFSRTFIVDPNTFYHGLEKVSNQSLNSVQTNGNPYAIGIGDGGPEGARYITTIDPASDVIVAAKEFFASLGVNLNAPPGKSVFFNDRLGRLFVKATAEDLDTIGRAISALNQAAPQIHIKARFIEVPKGTLAGLTKMVTITNQPAQSNQLASITGILSNQNFAMVLRSLEARDGFESLAEPEVTTTSGRQTQMRATEVQTIVTNVVFNENATSRSNSIVYQTSQIETGPILDMVPYVLSDGFTINLSLIPSLTEFLGYETPTNAVGPVNSAGVHLPVILPKFSVRQAVASVNISDNQTVVLGGLVEKKIFDSKGKVAKPPASDKELLVFVTVTIVDPAGNRVHSVDELPFWPKGIPSQPGAK